MRTPGCGWLAAATVIAVGHAHAATPSCIDVHQGSTPSYACLNQALKATAEAERPVSPAPDVDARSAPTRVGTFNQGAVREHLGGNFGLSARPPPLPPR